MQFMVALCALLVQLALTVQCASPKRQQQQQGTVRTGASDAQNDRKWRAGTYLGLTMGRSTQADVLRVLGKPQRVDTPADQRPRDPNPEIWYVYSSGGEFPGELTVVIDKKTGVVLAIDLYPNNLRREEAVKHFGSDYILTKYDFDKCLGNEESAPVYESANGSLLEIEYRHRGIAISVTQDGKVNTISYVSKPIGAAASKCK